MDWISVIADFFNNSSVSAFLGAAAAFLLVFLTDLRRKSKRRCTLRVTLAGALNSGKRKHQWISNNRSLFRDQDRIHPGDIQSFPVALIEALFLDLYDEIPHDERLSMESLLFRMRAIDSILDGIRQNAERLYRLYID